MFQYRPILVHIEHSSIDRYWSFFPDRYWYTFVVPVSTDTGTLLSYQYRPTLVHFCRTTFVVLVSTDTGAMSRSSIERYLHTSVWDLKYTFSYFSLKEDDYLENNNWRNNKERIGNVGRAVRNKTWDNEYIEKHWNNARWRGIYLWTFSSSESVVWVESNFLSPSPVSGVNPSFLFDPNAMKFHKPFQGPFLTDHVLHLVKLTRGAHDERGFTNTRGLYACYVEHKRKMLALCDMFSSTVNNRYSSFIFHLRHELLITRA